MSHEVARNARGNQTETADLRLCALRLLAEARGYRANESLLSALLREWGHVVSRDRLRAELAWLGEQGLVAIDEIGGVMIATLTERGQDAATGAASVPGVRRPGPESPSSSEAAGR